MRTWACLLLAVISVPAPLAAAAVPGVVIDHSPTRSMSYIGSPSLAVLPSGDYVASHDFFGPGSTRDTTVLFISTDRGKTWRKQAQIKGQWWSTLFVHRQHLYLLGTTREYGNCVIRRSLDAGKTWTEPKDKDSGLLLDTGMYHCAPVPVVKHNGRLWRAMEEYTGPKWGAFKAFVMSVPEDADLLKASNWICTNRIGPEEKWLGGKVGGILEGNAVVAPQGKVVNILRVHQPSFDEQAALMRVSEDGKTLSFDPAWDFIPFPGGSKKFTIRYDEKSRLYWALANPVPREYQLPGRRPDQVRNTLALISSPDLRKWQVKKDLLQDPDVKTVGFQYADWLFDGDDLIAVVRTAFPEADGTTAHNAHDANFLIFLRVEGARK
jgi:hypothetical protein